MYSWRTLAVLIVARVTGCRVATAARWLRPIAARR